MLGMAAGHVNESTRLPKSDFGLQNEAPVTLTSMKAVRR
jgi:hypothetical protein